MENKSQIVSPGRTLVMLLAFLLVVIGGGLLVAPLVFNFVLWLGRSCPALEGCREVDFDSLASRCLLVVALLGLFPFLRMVGFRSWKDLGFAAEGKGVGLVAKSCFFGSLSMVCLFAFGWLLKAYVWDFEFEPRWLWKAAAFLVGALIVGLMEETIFRGVLFGVMQRALGFIGGAFFSSAIFALMHFAAPEWPAGVVYGHWYSGLAMLPYLFRDVGFNGHCFPVLLTLFFMGLSLCTLYRLTGNLYSVIGLHAGWVWVIRLASDILARDRHEARAWFGTSGTIVNSPAILVLIVLFWIVLVVVLRKKMTSQGRS